MQYPSAHPPLFPDPSTSTTRLRLVDMMLYSILELRPVVTTTAPSSTINIMFNMQDSSRLPQVRHKNLEREPLV